MGKVTDVTQLRKSVHDGFKNQRGALVAFCREHGYSRNWVRMVLSGEFDCLQVLIEAADFIPVYRDRKIADRQQKLEVLATKVAMI